MKRVPVFRAAISCVLIPCVLIAACHTQPSVEHREVRQAATSADSDCDGISDELEQQYGLDPGDPADADADADGDDVPNLYEIRLGGDPRSPDSDGDGIADGIDLQLDLDQDGDGIASADDNCAEDPNRDQRDHDKDGVGDACDPDAPSVRIAEAWSTAAKDHALLPLEGGEASRVLADRADLMPMPSSFRLIASTPTTLGKVVAVHELYHATTRDHAYASTQGEVATLIRGGYRDLGVLGYTATEPLGGLDSVAVRRFVRSHEHAVTVDDATALALVADGYTEQSILGYAGVDQGHLRHPRRVVRFELEGASPTVYRHQSGPIASPGYRSDGPRFRVLGEKIGGARPLLRARHWGLEERLSTDLHEVASWASEDYVADGLIGWILDDPRAMPFYETAELWRLERAGEHRYSVERDEIETLEQDGWSRTLMLGYAFRGLERAATCAGPTPADRLETVLASPSTRPDERARATLVALVVSCAIERVLDGKPSANVIEAAVATSVPVDGEVRRRLRANVERWHHVDPAVRATALGQYAHLDPGTCDKPTDVDSLAHGIQVAAFEYSGAPPSLREPHCSGQLYAPTDPASGTAAEARAVTVNAKPIFEFGDANAAKPRLVGMLDTDAVRGHPAAEAWAAANPGQGLNLSGVDTGIPCASDAQCPATQGLRCVQLSPPGPGSCFAYPIVKNQEIHTFLGSNFWDVIDGHVLLRDSMGRLTPIPDEILANEPADSTRCSPYSSLNRATIERPLSVDAGQFYEVEVVNTNGTFYEHPEEIPDDEDEARANGRTIHVCWGANDPDRPADTVTGCTMLNEGAAACPLDGPACSTATGGQWGAQPPRSLAQCRTTQCGETPREFSSRPATATQRQFIFVEQSPPRREIVTTVRGVTCHEETGWDRLGSDELALVFTGVVEEAATPPGGPVLKVQTEGYQRSFDSGDRRKQQSFQLAARAVAETNGGTFSQEAFGITALEDDSEFWETLLVVGTITIAAVAISVLLPGLGTYIAAGGVAAALIALWMVHILTRGADDLLGYDTGFLSVFDVTSRGAQSHDLVYDFLPQLPTFGDTDEFEAHVGSYHPSKHPAVDNFDRQYNWDVMGVECTTNADCSGGDTCAIGLCVAPGWRDLEPGVGGAPAGFLERREFYYGSSWRYDIYLGWHVSAPLPQP